MGVHGLWDLLSPVGRRVSVETLAGKKLAIDASIWMVQFMKAMRDEKGEMIRNAHLLGFFRRICKLLFLRTKPVFVFDGGTPALKRRTVIARRRQRENAKAKIRKTAEKLLLNQLKAMKLKELAEDIKNQRKKNDSKGKKVISDQNDMVGDNPEKDHETMTSYDQEKLDEMLAASLAAEEGGRVANNASTSATKIPSEEEDDVDEDLILPEPIDTSVLAALPQSMQHNLFDKIKRKRFSEPSKDAGDQKLDKMLAASIAAEQAGSSGNMASTSSMANLFEEDGDEDEEMILPEMHGKVDPAVLASLPPSMQLDLLVQMRERLMAENRQKYQKVKKDPTKFSELQIQSYLKTVAFRREIDGVQKSASGTGIGGVQTSRIASEANREFIFSSSFSGDKQQLTSAGAEKTGPRQQEAPAENPSILSSDSIDGIASTMNSNSLNESLQDISTSAFDDDVGAYLDERGRVRVSRVRGMGIRMTRDLQRNLDLMKEIDRARENAGNHELPTKSSTDVDDSVNSEPVGILNDRNTDTVSLTERNGESLLKSETCIEVSLNTDNADKNQHDDDDIFARLVEGNPVAISIAGNSPKEQICDSSSDCDWEEGVIQGEGDSFSGDKMVASKALLEDYCSDDSDVQWVEGTSDVPKTTSPFSSEVGTISKGDLEEESALQEALKRSLDDVRDKSSDPKLSEIKQTMSSGFKDHEDTGFCDQQIAMDELNIHGGNSTWQHKPPSEYVEESLGDADEIKTSEAIGSPTRKLESTAKENSYIKMPLEEPCVPHSPEQAKDDVAKIKISGIKSFWTESSYTAEGENVNMVGGHLLDTSSLGAELTTSDKMTEINERVDLLGSSEAGATLVDVNTNDPVLPSLTETIRPVVPGIESSIKDLISDGDVNKRIDEAKECGNILKEKVNMDNSAVGDDEIELLKLTESNLEEEMLAVGRESLNLGVEQRKLERNAESVSSEMFAECQELLQMFGLPYIIAPMEAEAQCAYMEVANLVDGVVTDDSDVFLFGARSVYKNIFDDRKYVETYFMKDIEDELGLTREKLVQMALLLGSDYTEGISGIGIVNAMEVVNAFPEADGLVKFREWVESPDPTILGKLDTQSGSARKKGPKFSESGLNHPENNVEGVSTDERTSSQAHENQQATDHLSEVKWTFMENHRNISKNWHIPSSFPSEAVISAYFSPQVDRSTEPFSWGKPDTSVLRKLCWEKFGWTNKKSDDLLQPVLKEYTKHETQLRLEAFYTFNERFAKIRSKRIKKAVKESVGQQTSELIDDAVEGVSRGRKKRKAGTGKPGSKKLEKKLEGIEESEVGCQNTSADISNSNTTRTAEIPVEPSSIALQSSEQSMPTELQKNTKKQSRSSGRRGRGQGVGRGRGRGRVRQNPGVDLSEPSFTDDSSDNDVEEVFVNKTREPNELRRSKRPRKPVSYTVDNLEVEEGSNFKHRNEKKHVDEAALETALSGNQEAGSNAADAFKDEHYEPGDPSVEKGLSSDYVETGSGFRGDEEENGIRDISQDSKRTGDAVISKEYLQMGGGFCLEEDEEGKELDELNTPAAAPSSNTIESLRGSGVINQTDFASEVIEETAIPQSAVDKSSGASGADASDINDAKSAHTKTSASEVETNDNYASAGFLSAMPSLRRKRRKH